jgi:hypothetical protein
MHTETLKRLTPCETASVTLLGTTSDYNGEGTFRMSIICQIHFNWYIYKNLKKIEGFRWTQTSHFDTVTLNKRQFISLTGWPLSVEKLHLSDTLCPLLLAIDTYRPHINYLDLFGWAVGTSVSSAKHKRQHKLKKTDRATPCLSPIWQR